MSTLLEIMDALADQLHDELDSLVEGIQIEPRLNINPSPDPIAIDMYSADQEPSVGAFGYGNTDYLVTVRARINTPDSYAAQDVLLGLIDFQSTTSMWQAVMSDTTLGSTVQNVAPEAGPTTFGIFPDASGTAAFLGCTWTVRIVP